MSLRSGFRSSCMYWTAMHHGRLSPWTRHVRTSLALNFRKFLSSKGTNTVFSHRAHGQEVTYRHQSQRRDHLITE